MEEVSQVGFRKKFMENGHMLKRGAAAVFFDSIAAKKPVRYKEAFTQRGFNQLKVV